jgi:type II secretory ATPase GspE/PulE/Tfp pilus assembly ATPase PilB-like protein
METTATKQPRSQPASLTPAFDKVWKKQRPSFLAGLPEHTEEIMRALLTDALSARASDVHFDPLSDSFQVRFRIDGALHRVMMPDLEEGMRMVRFFKAAAGLDPGNLITPHDARAHFEIDGRDLEVRLALAPAVTGEKLALRLLWRDRLALNLGELGLAASQRDEIGHWLNNASGMFLAAGPVGSGKTTTLYALIAELDLARRNIVTIEDPVEYQVDGLNQLQADERHGLAMGGALKTILRLDPDFILIGEIRDETSARAAIDAAGTGKIVLSTLHARDAAGTVTSLRNLGATDHQIAVALSFVVAQRLVRKLCPECRTQGTLEKPDRAWLERLHLDVPQTIWKAVGCPRCAGTGYYGRSGVFELWPVDWQAYDLILAGADEATIRRHVRNQTESDILKAGLEQAAAGLTTLTELRGMSGVVRAR